jgi:hypothetical protein
MPHPPLIGEQQTIVFPYVLRGAVYCILNMYGVSGNRRGKSYNRFIEPNSRIGLAMENGTFEFNLKFNLPSEEIEDSHFCFTFVMTTEMDTVGCVDTKPFDASFLLSIKGIN